MTSSFELTASPPRPHADDRLRWTVPLSLVACLAAGVLALVHSPHDYVERMAPAWFVLAGAAVATVALLAARTPTARVAGLVTASVLLLPSGGALLAFHGLRLVRAIPLPLDPVSAGVSLVAGGTLVALWVAPNRLRPVPGVRLEIPRWVAFAGIVASLTYPVLKVSWALGSSWSAPAGAVGVVDVTFGVTTAFALAAVPALAIALRWWDRPAPRWARPAAFVGGMALTSLGIAGLWSVWLSHDEKVSGLLVYGGWLVWGLCTLAVSGRLTARAHSQLDAYAARG